MLIKLNLSKVLFILSLGFVLGACPCEINLPPTWAGLNMTVADRMDDQQAKLTVRYISELQTPVPHLQQLQKTMPNSTVALFAAVQFQDMLLSKAEDVASNLQISAAKLSGRQLRNFDEQTAQTLERNWRELSV